jgi:pSer/pThr/pTyr-binding forkhead associated (FHA) protein/uncharacterized membrane protein (UPF0136 family)
MGQILFTALAGAVAGLFAWIVMSPFELRDYHDPNWATWTLWWTFFLGGFIAAALGGVLGYAQGSRSHILRGVVFGFIVGAIGSMMGWRIGSTVAFAIFGPLPASFDVRQIPALMITIAPTAGLIGLAMGIPGRSWRQAAAGFIGGVIGGLIAGATFHLISGMTSGLVLMARGGAAPTINEEVGTVGRAVSSAVIGLAIGLFASIAQRASRSAWLRLQLGRNEGREWIVDAPQTFIGRSETAHVPLFGDHTVAPMHALITRHGGAFLLADGGSPTGTFLNGYPLPPGAQAPLQHGSQIQIGRHQLVFLMKAGAAARAAESTRGGYPISGQAYPGPAAAAPYPQGPHPQPTQQVGGYPGDQPYGQQPHPSMPHQSTQQTQMAPPAAQMQAGPGPTLVAVSGPLTGQRIPIQGPLEAGREAPGITLGFDGMASRRHAGFTPTPQGLVVTDLGSTNGTFVNDQRVQSATLKPGDIVRIGVTSFRVE